ncbi:DUF742 domain-containing protein [Streptomyces sp. SRF1]|uniref:DUF742 domain-containing protein n=1 Tax=Streptomyces sp. SRF1 TaxID=1549642 RepID=UPI0025B24BAC|nr:DUF742 domain-containing protein [Streptomyces sp. SRF1]MDN3060093.1 DUF742 domain-containing protein [Streptomyces sp. SRF1]
MNDQGGAGRRSRAFTATGGRVQPLDDDIRLDTHVTPTSSGGDTLPLTEQQSQLISLCRPACAVAELAARMDLPLAVVTALVHDLRARGRVTTDQVLDLTSDTVISTALLQRLRDRLHAI